MELIKKSDEVYLAPGPIAAIGDEEVEFLRARVATSPRGRVRINLHAEGADPLHEMFIAIRKESYIRPHRHPAKSEAFHIVHGEVDVVVFEDDGSIRSVVPLAAANAGKAFYYRMSAPLFHTLVIHSDLLIVHEITNGPFKADATLFGDFSPEDGNAPEILIWQQKLADQIRGRQ